MEKPFAADSGREGGAEKKRKWASDRAAGARRWAHARRWLSSPGSVTPCSWKGERGSAGSTAENSRPSNGSWAGEEGS